MSERELSEAIIKAWVRVKDIAPTEAQRRSDFKRAMVVTAREVAKLTRDRIEVLETAIDDLHGCIGIPESK